MSCKRQFLTKVADHFWRACYIGHVSRTEFISLTIIYHPYRVVYVPKLLPPSPEPPPTHPHWIPGVVIVHAQSCIAAHTSTAGDRLHCPQRLLQHSDSNNIRISIRRRRRSQMCVRAQAIYGVYCVDKICL